MSIRTRKPGPTKTSMYSQGSRIYKLGISDLRRRGVVPFMYRKHRRFCFRLCMLLVFSCGGSIILELHMSCKTFSAVYQYFDGQSVGKKLCEEVSSSSPPISYTPSWVGALGQKLTTKGSGMDDYFLFTLSASLLYSSHLNLVDSNWMATFFGKS